MSRSVPLQAVPRAVLWAGIAVLAVFFLFARALRYDFSPWDDEPNIVYNASYQQPLTPATLGSFWQRGYHDQYMPVTWSAWAFCAEVGRGAFPRPVTGETLPFRPLPFHALALGAHVGVVALVFGLLRRCIPAVSPWPAVAGALFFGMHPLQTEAAAWINGGNITLAYLFGFAALYLLIDAVREERHGFDGRLVFATVCYLLALLSKPATVTIPLLGFMLGWGVLKVPVRRLAPVLGIWLALGAVIVLVNAQGKNVLPLAQSPPLLRPLVAADALAFYLGKIAWPFSLACSYGRTPRAIFANGSGYLTGIIPLALAAMVWFAARIGTWSEPVRRTVGTAGGVLLLGTLPTLGLVPFYYQYHSTVADRYVYPAMLGPALLLAFGLARAEETRFRTLANSAAALLLAGYAVLSWRQTPVWQNGVTLFANAVRVTPGSPDMHFNLARNREMAGDTPGAVQEYQETLRRDPKYVAAYTNLGVLLMNHGNPQAGARAHELALQLLPGQPQSNYWLGVYHADRREWSAAARYYRTALLGLPGDANIQRRLAEAEAKAGRP